MKNTQAKPSQINLTGNDTKTILEMNGNEIEVEYLPNVPYENYGKELTLQILQPNAFNHPEQTYPAIVFVQGSHWATQNVYRRVSYLTKLAAKGYVVAITQYRDYEAGFHFPDPIIDAKNAIRFLKANADTYHIQKENFIIMGDSSGGQVATVAGMTAKTALFDQPINDETPDVKGIIDLYGAVDLSMKGGFPSTGDSHSIKTPEGSEMGFDIPTHLEKTATANSKTYVNEDFPPMLIAHGTGDTTVSDQESIELYEAIKAAGKPVHLYLIKGATHGNNAFYDQRMTDIYDQFIRQCLDN
ncbi:alpha/beta hydrolase [Limosilactobacillus caecicola]|uniref:alpha/beta hydrolase n=1 Tax=Limosilactobacillus caecicola TaxID=2941332 RepID=UPI00203DFC3A|nr:alpha/beta hydrolase [Limosilactobacillus caecicola]